MTFHLNRNIVGTYLGLFQTFMDNLREIESNKAKIIDLLKKIDFSKNQIREYEQEIDSIEFKLKLSEKEHERSLNYIKEIEEGLKMDLDELWSEKDEYEQEQYDLRDKEIQTEIERNWKQTMREEEEFYRNKEKLNKSKEKFEILITTQQNNIDKWSTQISKLSTINKELNDSQSIQVKVTLNYEENIILEELVKISGTNKSSVLRDMIKDHNDLKNERDSLKNASDRLLFEMKKKFELLEQEKQSEMQTKINELRLDSSKKTQELEKIIISLKAELQTTIKEKDKEAQIAEISREKEITNVASNLEIQKNELKAQLEKIKEKNALIQKSIEEKYKLMVEGRDSTIEDLRAIRFTLESGMKDEKKLKGAELESFCEKEFNKIRSIAFPRAFFDKQSTINGAKKADLIYRDFDESGNEILSIIFELKDKQFDSKAIQDLDKLRTESKCDYAILISDYEREGESNNYDISDLCHEYPKMFAIRPNFFTSFLSILKSISLDSKCEKKDSPTITEYFEPENFDAIPSIIESLQRGLMVIINLTLIETKERQRFSDILIGATFGIKGSIKNIGDLTYVFTPVNHLIKKTKINKKDLDDDTQDYLKNSFSN